MISISCLAMLCNSLTKRSQPVLFSGSADRRSRSLSGEIDRRLPVAVQYAPVQPLAPPNNRGGDRQRTSIDESASQRADVALSTTVETWGGRNGFVHKGRSR